MSTTTGFAPLQHSVSHGVVQRRLSPQDGPIYPSLTSSATPTDAYLEETTTGLVDAAEATTHGLDQAESRWSTATIAVDPEKAAGADNAGGAKLVTWLENDPENPRNFSKAVKWTVTLLASMLCFCSGFASSIVTGGLSQPAREFGVTSEIINLAVCLFVVGFGVGPLFFAPLSEIYGRRLIYLISVAFFFIFTIPSAVAKTAAVHLVFRFFAGLGASATMTNAAGTISDVWSVEERGNKMATFSAILFASPCLGPPIGGYIAMYAGWRWIYYVLLIFTGVCWITAAIFLRETYSPVLLKRRATKLRKETGDSTIMTEQERTKRPFSAILQAALVRPLVMLFTEAIMIAFSAYLCLIYGLLYGFFFAYPIVFQQGHGFNDGQTGLAFFGIFIGIILVAMIGCPLQEKYYQRKVAAGEATPETRLPLMMACSLLLPVALFIFAWTSLPHVHWSGAAISGIPFGFSLVGIYISANTYLVDAYSLHSASAMAAKTFIRSLAGASMPMWVPLMYARLGNGWSGSIMAFVAVAMLPIPFVFYTYGERIRKISKLAT